MPVPSGSDLVLTPFATRHGPCLLLAKGLDRRGEQWDPEFVSDNLPALTRPSALADDSGILATRLFPEAETNSGSDRAGTRQ